jgi:MFS family permease
MVRSNDALIMGLSSVVILLGQVGGPMVAGVLSDATGNYRLGFTVLAILAGLGSGFFLLAKRPALPSRGPALETTRDRQTAEAV